MAAAAAAAAASAASSSSPSTHIQTIPLGMSVDGKPTFITLAHFHAVTNASDLVAQVSSGDVPMAAINASMILDAAHVLAAVAKALASFCRGKLKTRTVTSELVFCLSLSTNIKTCFRTFGVAQDEAQPNVLLVGVNVDEAQVHEVCARVQGTPVAVADLRKHADVEKIVELYQVTPEERTIGEEDALLSSVLTHIAAG